MSVPGALRSRGTRYQPNELGYCGPDGAAALLHSEKHAEIARRGPHIRRGVELLEVIAEAAGIADPPRCGGGRGVLDRQ